MSYPSRSASYQAVVFLLAQVEAHRCSEVLLLLQLRLLILLDLRFRLRFLDDDSVDMGVFK